MPLNMASTHVVSKSDRIRKLLLNRQELNHLTGLTERQGFTIVTLSLNWKKSWAKLQIGLAKGKKEYHKQGALQEREWLLSRERVMKKSLR